MAKKGLCDLCRLLVNLQDTAATTVGFFVAYLWDCQRRDIVEGQLSTESLKVFTTYNLTYNGLHKAFPESQLLHA